LLVGCSSKNYLQKKWGAREYCPKKHKPRISTTKQGAGMGGTTNEQ
jgi:hypothetical protein